MTPDTPQLRQTQQNNSQTSLGGGGIRWGYVYIGISYSHDYGIPPLPILWQCQYQVPTEEEGKVNHPVMTECH